jgi:hypothetical protein
MKNKIIPVLQGDVLPFGEADEFFAPVSSDMIDGLISQYQSVKSRVHAVSEFVKQEINGGVIHYFLDGNCDEKNGRMSLKRSAGHLFDPTGAMAALNSSFWSKAMHLTDVLNYMPQKRRDDWNKAITEMTCPEFEEETVRDTLMSLLNMRSQFLAERVDGIFRGLSGEHVTNSPSGFGKRMILARVLSEWHTENHSMCGLINDLRCVVAKFMGRDEPGYSASSSLVRTLKGRWGEWVSIDGGALRIRLYKKGTAHLEVHPDMAWRLNATLAHLYPMAIPAEFRTKPKRKPKDIQLIQRPLPFAVVELLAELNQAVKFEKQEGNWREPYKRIPIKNAVEFGRCLKDKHAISEAEKILESIGGVKRDKWFQFDYNPLPVIEEIVASGCIPDQKAHQFYPTPESLAKKVIELASACAAPGMNWLEPSAGIGCIADLVPEDAFLQCYEISELHCKVLESKGYDRCGRRAVRCLDFLKLAREYRGGGYHRIVMNPPFDRGQWQSHVEHAAGMLTAGGRLVAIVPASAKDKFCLPGFKIEWSEVLDNQFAGTGISVVIMVATLLCASDFKVKSNGKTGADASDMLTHEEEAYA